MAGTRNELDLQSAVGVGVGVGAWAGSIPYFLSISSKHLIPISILNLFLKEFKLDFYLFFIL